MDKQRIFVGRRPGMDFQAQDLLAELTSAAAHPGLEHLRIINCYEISGLGRAELLDAVPGLFLEAPKDLLLPQLPDADFSIAREFLPGQFDKRSASAAQGLRLLFPGREIEVHRSDLFLFDGRLADSERRMLRHRLINPVEARLKDLSRFSLGDSGEAPAEVPVIGGFRTMNEGTLETLRQSEGITLDQPDLIFIRDWFSERENRDPTLAELKVLDAYWSDHCRHRTFETELKSIRVAEGAAAEEIRDALAQWDAARANSGRTGKPKTLMDLACVAAREARETGCLDDWDSSEEVNACTLKIEALIDGVRRPWLLSFKNETHNHPTEIEPRGGASTCLGGAVRDPLAGRCYVHQAVRVTGGADPRQPSAGLPEGKLPQRLIALGAAEGYSSYGNQLGIPCTLVREHYHPGYAAKRLECGAVMGAAPAENVIRRRPEPGNTVILLGGRTGRDGVGGAAGSSEAHDEESIRKAGAEVQKGNPPEERKLQRLFRNPQAARMIRRCNDFGAGGIAVAVGELADGLVVDLDSVPVKYRGLTGVELAVSESQERMAALVSASDETKLMELARRENIEAVRVARVSADRRLAMSWRGQAAVNLSRDLLDACGAPRRAEALIVPGDNLSDTMPQPLEFTPGALKTALASPESAAKVGLEERFDGTVGGTTVLAPRGGRRQMTPAEASVQLLPADGRVETVGIMAVGFDPALAAGNPFRGGQFALIEALSAVCAVGGNWRRVRFSLQEYFGRTDRGPEAWGRPLAALLGALTVQRRWKLPAIGGKDSMSGSFRELDVPPTIIAFAVTAEDLNRVVAAAFPEPGLSIAVVRPKEISEAPQFDVLAANWDWIRSLGLAGSLSSAARIGPGGWAVKMTLMALGNGIGAELANPVPPQPFRPDYGGLIISTPLSPEQLAADAEKAGAEMEILGRTINRPHLVWPGGELSLNEAESAWLGTYRELWPADRDGGEGSELDWPNRDGRADSKPDRSPAAESSPTNPAAPTARHGAPRVCIPVFPGTNGEDDARRAFGRQGARAVERVFLDRDPAGMENALADLASDISASQILCIPGGFSAGDEPDGAGKYIAAVLRHPRVADAIAGLLERGGLVLGICNGFQALIKSGWLVEGKPGIPKAHHPTLVRNRVGRHLARAVKTVAGGGESPWMLKIPAGTVHTVAVSHGEGRFAASKSVLDNLFSRGRMAFRYCDDEGRPSMAGSFNPNGSAGAVEGMLSPCGRILGKMGHSERWRGGTMIDVPGMEVEQPLIAGGVQWFR